MKFRGRGREGREKVPVRRRRRRRGGGVREREEGTEQIWGWKKEKQQRG